MARRMLKKTANGGIATSRFPNSDISQTSGGNLTRVIESACEANDNTLSDDLICLICRKEYKNPKLLPCLHTFCKHCVKNTCVEPQDTEVLRITCPLCFSLHEMASIDDPFEDLASDFIALNMLDARAMQRVVNGDTSVCANCRSDGAQAMSRCSECALFLCVKCERAHHRTKATESHSVFSFALLHESAMHRADYCATHTGEEMTYYCQTCDRPVCNDCTFLDHPKIEHALTTLPDATTTQRRQLAELLSNVRRKLPFMKRTLLDIDSVLQAVPDHADAVAREIARTTETFIHALKQRQEQLLDDLTQLCLQKEYALYAQKRRIQRVLKVSEANCQTTENILRTGSDSEISTVHSLVCERMKSLDKTMVDVEAIDTAEFNYDTNEAALTTAILSNGKVSLSPPAASLRVMGDGLHDAAVGKVAMFTLAKSGNCLVSPGDVDVRIETPDSVILGCDVTQGGSLYAVSYIPKVPGEHEISVTFRGEHSPDSPVCVNVKNGHMVLPVAHARCSVFGHRGSAPGCFDQVCDVAVRSNGSILAVDSFNHRVQAFTCKGSFISHFGMKGDGLGRLSYPVGLAISPKGHVIVTEHGNHRVQAFTSDGAHLWTFGGHGNAEGLMDHPTGIAVDEEGQLVVVDQHNHRVQVFNASGCFKYQFGCHGNQDGQFDHPMFVAINQDGEIFVTDSGNDRVQIFDVGGCFQRSFGRAGTKDGEFYCPTGVTIDACGYVIVSDQSGRIQVFSPELDFVMRFDTRDEAGDKVDCFMGLDYTPDGKIAVADKGSDNVKILCT